jgi:DNA mismatch repair ATPase MutS
MGIVQTAKNFERLERLDAVWIQVGAFMELYGDSAIAVNKAFGLAIWHRQGTPTVGVPVSHAEKWAHRTASLGLNTGIVMQVTSGSKVPRELTAVMRGALSKI